MAYPSSYYFDPINAVDSLRQKQKYRKEHSSDTCDGCDNHMGKYWDIEVCKIGKRRYPPDGYCRWMDKSTGR